MVGDGPERERIRNLAIEKGLENIVFARVPYEGSNDLYSVAYASVATLRNVPVAQGMRLSKIFPALSCGVPVIYSGEGEAAELLRNHRCGITVAPEDASALAEAISKLAQNPGMRHELGKNGRSLVQHEYSWSTIVDRWLQQMEHPDTNVPSAVEQSNSRATAADTSALRDTMLAGVTPRVNTGAEQ
jgi:glycosyltransferase involved in cell wall biosynthesis